MSRDTTVIQCLNLAPFAFVLFASSLHHFERHQITGRASRHGLRYSVFLGLIGESGKMLMVGVKFVLVFRVAAISSITDVS